MEKHCFLSMLVNENDNANANADSDNVILTIKYSKLYVPVIILSAKGNQKTLNFFSKVSERSVYWNQWKQKLKSQKIIFTKRYNQEL